MEPSIISNEGKDRTAFITDCTLENPMFIAFGLRGLSRAMKSYPRATNSLTERVRPLSKKLRLLSGRIRFSICGRRAFSGLKYLSD
jgi:hypothetical protein